MDHTWSDRRVLAQARIPGSTSQWPGAATQQDPLAQEVVLVPGFPGLVPYPYGTSPPSAGRSTGTSDRVVTIAPGTSISAVGAYRRAICGN
jgi:hypothetical protein